MGEIKSTLELVLERTKHLTLSEGEKKEQRLNEFTRKIKGLIQRYRNKLINKDSFQDELTSWQHEYGLDYRGILFAEAAEKIDPDRDNQELLELLEDICGEQVERIRTLCSKYRDDADSIVQRATDSAKAVLAEKHSITGSAVVPNLESDTTWRVEMEQIRIGFADQLHKEIDHLARACR